MMRSCRLKKEQPDSNPGYFFFPIRLVFSLAPACRGSLIQHYLRLCVPDGPAICEAVCVTLEEI